MEIIHSSENEAFSRVKPVLHWLNVPVSVGQVVFENMKSMATFAAKRYKLLFI